MKLHVLGSNGASPSDSSETSCFAIPEVGIILDAGTGLHRFASFLQTNQIDVYLSHPHMDHLTGLLDIWFCISRKLMPDLRNNFPEATLKQLIEEMLPLRPQVCIHAAEEHMDIVKEYAQGWRCAAFQWLPTTTSTEILRNNGTIRRFPMRHRPNLLSYGYRMDWPGHSLAYITDTCCQGVDSDYANVINGVDVLLHECYLPDDDDDYARQIGHSSITPIAQLAAKAKVDRLVLIHLNPFRVVIGAPDVESVKDIFANISVATDDMVIDF